MNARFLIDKLSVGAIIADETSGSIPAERHIPSGKECQREEFK
jgi:hypothetical protein